MRSPLSSGRLPCLLLLLLAGVRAAPAQEPAADTAQAGVRAALDRIRPGTPLRVHTRAVGWVEAPLVAVENGVLVVQEAGEARHIPVAGVTEIRARERQTRRGAVIGGAVVGTAAFLYSAWFGAVIGSISDASTGEVAAFAVGGGLLGTAGGALTGGIIGSTVPRWRRVYRTKEAGAPIGTAPLPILPTAPASRVEPRRIASVEVTAGYAHTPEDGGTGGGFATRAALLGEFDVGESGGTFAAVGLEGGWSGLGATPVREEVIVRFDPDRLPRMDTVHLRREYAIVDLGGVARVGTELGGVRPYALLGLGVQRWRTDVAEIAEPGEGDLPAFSLGGIYTTGLSVGAGARLRGLGGPYSLGVEGRWHTIPAVGQREDGRASGFWTLGATVVRSW